MYGRGQWLGRALLVGGTGVLVLAIATMARAPSGLVAVMVVILAAVDLLLLWWTTNRARSPRGDGGRTTTLLAVCWVLIALFGMHNIDHRPTSAVVSQGSIQTALELLLFMAVGAYAVHLLRVGPPPVGIGAPLLLLPIWMLASTTWAITPLYAIARGCELVALALLALATASHCLADPAARARLPWTVMRWIVIVTAGLAAAGVVWGPRYVLANDSNLERFTWIGAHPGDAGLLLAVALGILVCAPAARLRIPLLARPMLIVGLGAALYANQTRTVAASVAVVVALQLALTARRRPGVTALAVLFTFGAGVLAAGAIAGYVLRGDDTGSLWSLNGRSELWGVGYDHLHGFTDWLIGLGYGASRVIFVDEFAFATNAHNALLAALVDGGLIGAALLLLGVLGQIRRSVVARLVPDHGFGAPLVAVLVVVILSGTTSDHLVMPSMSSVLLYFFAAVTAAVLTALPTASADGAHEGPAEEQEEAPPVLSRPGTPTTGAGGR